MIRHLDQSLEPLTLGESADLDSRVSVATFKRHNHDPEGFHTGGPTVMQIIRDYLRLDETDRVSWIKARGAKRSPYRGSGEWCVYRATENGPASAGIVISVDIGCHCEHDCCGHACSLHHRIEQTGSMTIVTTSRGFNY